MLTDVSREERRLIRQRGAGTRKLEGVEFGFAFGGAGPSPPQASPRVATTTAPAPSLDDDDDGEHVGAAAKLVKRGNPAANARKRPKKIDLQSSGQRSPEIITKPERVTKRKAPARTATARKKTVVSEDNGDALGDTLANDKAEKKPNSRRKKTKIAEDTADVPQRPTSRGQDTDSDVDEFQDAVTHHPASVPVEQAQSSTTTMPARSSRSVQPDPPVAAKRSRKPKASATEKISKQASKVRGKKARDEVLGARTGSAQEEAFAAEDEAIAERKPSSPSPHDIEAASVDSKLASRDKLRHDAILLVPGADANDQPPPSPPPEAPKTRRKRPELDESEEALESVTKRTQRTKPARKPRQKTDVANSSKPMEDPGAPEGAAAMASVDASRRVAANHITERVELPPEHVVSKPSEPATSHLETAGEPQAPLLKATNRRRNGGTRADASVTFPHFGGPRRKAKDANEDEDAGDLAAILRRYGDPKIPANLMSHGDSRLKFRL